MNKILDIAEDEMIELKHPYVGTEHFFLAYLKCYTNPIVSYDDFKNGLLEHIGKSNIVSEYVLYTPLLRKYVVSLYDEREVVIKILNDDNSIVFNILNLMGIDIKELLNNL